MIQSGIKRKAAILMVLAYASAYLISPANEAITVYASNIQTNNVAVQNYEAATLSITKQPQNVTVKPGRTVRFTIAAKGSGTLKYQWYYKKSGASAWSLWKGHTAASTQATANASWNMMQVRCKVTDNAGKSIDSSAAVITIDQPLTILTQPKNVTAKVGDTLKFTVAAQGKGKIKYQWYYKKSGASDWKLWKGHTAASTQATANASWDKMQLRCKVSDDSGNSVYSSAAVISFSQSLAILMQPQNVTAKAGQTVKFTVKAQGNGKIKYQWYYKKSGASNWTLWKGRTAASTQATANESWHLMQVRCTVSDQTGKSVNSSAAVITIDKPLTILTQPKNATVKVGDTAKFSVSAQGNGTVKYQWYYKKYGASDWTLWKGHTSPSASVVTDASWDGCRFYCAVSDASGKTVSSNEAEIIIPGKFRISKQPDDVTLQVGETAVFSVKATTKSSLKYQWYYKKAGKSEWTLWNEKTTPEISAVADCTWHGMQVYCKVTDSQNNSVNSNVAYALITKQSSKRYFTRYITIAKNYTKVYAEMNTKSKVIGKPLSNKTFVATGWDSDDSDTTWYCFDYDGQTGWVPRTSVRVKDDNVTIPDRDFSDGGIPVIYLSPSRLTANSYAVGNTTEQAQMYRVANELKTILENEYYCMVYTPPVSLKLGIDNRAYDAYIRDSDVYLAMHSNSNPYGYKIHGATTYFFPSCAQSKTLAQNIITEMGKVEFKKSLVKNKLVNGMNAYDKTGYGEVRDPSYFGMISVLAEVEYHHYAEPAKWIINNPNKIARALANSLENTLHMQKKPTAQINK